MDPKDYVTVLGPVEALARRLFQDKYKLDDAAATDLFFSLADDVHEDYMNTARSTIALLAEAGWTQGKRQEVKAPEATKIPETINVPNFARASKFYHPWTNEDVEKLLDIATSTNLSIAEIADKMGRSRGSVSGALSLLKRGLPVGKGNRQKQTVSCRRDRWNEDQLKEVLALRASGVPNKAIAKKFGRSPRAIQSALWKLDHQHPIGPLNREHLK